MRTARRYSEGMKLRSSLRLASAVVLSALVALPAACGESTTRDDDDDDPAARIEEVVHEKCEAEAGCNGGNARDRAACVEAEMNEFDQHEALGCVDEALERLECFVRNGTCFASSLVSEGCIEGPLQRCVAEAGSNGEPGPEVDDTYVAYCERKVACSGIETVVECSYNFQGAKRRADAYGCLAEHDTHFACLTTTAECVMGSFGNGICQEEQAARSACIAAVSAFD